MKYNIVSAVLLLLIVTDFSSGRAIQKRGLHEREVDLLDIDKKGRDNGGITVHGQLDDIKSLRKRVNLIEGTPPEGEDPGEGADGGEGSSTSNPKSVKSYLPRGITLCNDIHGCRESYLESYKGRDLASLIWPRASGEGAAGEGAAGEGAEGEGAQGEGAQGEGAQGEGAQGEGAQGEGAQGEGAQGEGAQGEEAQGDPPSDPPSEPAVVAQVPQGLGQDEMTLWDNMGNTPISLEPGDQVVLWAGSDALKQLTNFEREISAAQPGTAFKDIRTTISNWESFLTAYGKSPNFAQYKQNAITDIKFAEQIANRQEPIHIMYTQADGDNAPSDSFMTMAELGIVTSPTSMVTKIYRWDADTWDQVLDTPNIIWTNGQKPLAPEMGDLTNNPDASDNDATSSIFGGSDTGGDAGGNSGGDNDSDAGCLACVGISNCICASQ